MAKDKILKDEQVEKVTGGVAPNFANMTYEEALEIAEQLGQGMDMGSWKTMNGEEFMNLWKSMHPEFVEP